MFVVNIVTRTRTGAASGASPSKPARGTDDADDDEKEGASMSTSTTAALSTSGAAQVSVSPTVARRVVASSPASTSIARTLSLSSVTLDEAQIGALALSQRVANNVFSGLWYMKCCVVI
jgi:hypothetical protein